MKSMMHLKVWETKTYWHFHTHVGNETTNFSLNKFMKSIISTLAITLSIASFNFCAQAKTVKTIKPFIEVMNATQFPKIVKLSNENVVRQSFSLWIPQTSGKVSQLILNVPVGLKVGKDITVSDNSQRNLQPNIDVNDNQIVMNFPQPVSPGTTLNISLNEVSVFGVSNAWDYKVSAKFVGIDTKIPVGVVQFGIY